MRKYQSMPDQVVACWVDEDVHEKSGTVNFHYHNVEEWLEILKGEMTFFSAADRHEFPLGEGQALHIPQGEVHRVEIGPGGVTYRMWTPVKLPKPFRLDLDPDVLQLIERNLKVHDQENQWDRRDPSAPREELEQKDEYKFLSGFVAEDLIFHTAAGSVLRTREKYVWRTPSPGLWRSSSGSVRILDLQRDGPSGPVTSMLLSTVVHTRKEADPRNSVVNFRSFIKEPGGWVCRLWLNYREPQLGDGS